MRPTLMCLCGLLIFVTATMSGCGEEDPGPEPTQVGTITINPEPDGVNATWQLLGPNAFTRSGAGDATIGEMTTGSYTLTWGAVDGWTASSPAAVTRTLAAGETLTFRGTYVQNGGIPAGFVPISAGNLTMGSPADELGRDPDETQHQVTLTHGFYMQTTEVTNQQYRDMAQWAYDNGCVTTDGSALYDRMDGSTQVLKYLDAGNDEIAFSEGVFSCINPTHPVTWVTWYGSAAYCDWLSLQQGLTKAYDHSTWDCNAGNPYTATGYRLPTEAEWEYACRAETQTPFNTGSCLDAGTEANYDGSEPYTGCPTGPFVGGAVPVGSYPANAFGLYDMHGNYWEWCNDWYAPYGGTVTDPVGAGAASGRVIRGGSFYGTARSCGSARRSSNLPYYPHGELGFRPVRSTS
jgi:formylglycine-generating enzyme required for sulfatase activity